MTKGSAEGEREAGLGCLLKVTKDLVVPLLYLSFSSAKRTVVTLETQAVTKEYVTGPEVTQHKLPTGALCTPS